MTYGETSGLLREALGTLLRQHRIQQRIGGPGLHSLPVTCSPAERAVIGQQIRRYRHGVLLWCHQAVTAAIATSPALAGATRQTWQPVNALDRRLSLALQECPAGLPTMQELTTRQQFELVDTWRQAARAAALGEHDFPTSVRAGTLDARAAWAVLTDAAEVARALVILDSRYDNIPGWQSLHQRGHLGRVAASCAGLADLRTRDYSVDQLGWRPPLTLTAGPVQRGIGGVVRAEHDLLIHLNRFPTALNLKRIIDSQRGLSYQLAQRITEAEPALGDRWTTRATTYTRLFAEVRNLGGVIGDGAAAAAAGAVAFDRLPEVPSGSHLELRTLAALDAVFTRIDGRVADAIEHGVRHGLYLAKAAVPEIDVSDGRLVHAAPERFVLITSPDQTELLCLVRKQLRPHTPIFSPPVGASESRLDFESALNHRPGDPGPPRHSL